MWKIKITYSDKSKLTLTGKHKDIPYRIDELEEMGANGE